MEYAARFIRMVKEQQIEYLAEHHGHGYQPG